MKKLREKVLLSLLFGAAFGLAITPRRQWYVLKSAGKLWDESDNPMLDQEMREMNRLKLIKKINKKNGVIIRGLTKKGKLKALDYYFDNLKILNKKWDGKFRILVFDVPERLRKGRGALRWKIKRLGFRELQKSVFVFPYECKEEIDFVVDYFDLSKYVHYGVLESIDGELYSRLKKEFTLK
ncbi:MAG: hypothetical protein ABIJ84_00675 [bacterium]